MSSRYVSLRRYTPPTCTLEITAEDSPLSRWAGRSVLKRLRFQLRFDDPRLPEAEKIVVRGDRTQLEALSEVVETYVQNFLGEVESPSHPVAPIPGPSQSPQEPEVIGSALPELSPAMATASVLQPLETHPPEMEQSLNEQPPTAQVMSPGPRVVSLAAVAPSSPPSGIYLQPKGLLSHELTLGSLATEASSSTIKLSTLQLADLATALDEFAEDAMTLPDLNPAARWQAPPAWLRTAAVVLVTVGLTTAVVKLLDQSSTTNEPATAPLVSQRPSDPQSRLTQVPPVPPLAVPVPPPPSPAGSTFSPKPLPKITVPPTAPIPPSTVQLPIPPVPARSFPSATYNPPRQDTTPRDLAIPVPERSIATAPTTIAPSVQKAAPSPSQAAVSSLNSNIPNTEGIAESTPVRGQSSDSADSVNEIATAVPPVNRANLNDAPDRMTTAAPPAARSSQEERNGTRTNPTQNTAFDTVPQVSEARSYFQKRWQPPEGLTQTLEYTVLVDPKGTIERIIPLGQSAINYLDRTGMPLVGEPFVSPTQTGRSLRVRVVLSPDGKVQTFPE